jgi:hypothetical protein
VVEDSAAAEEDYELVIIPSQKTTSADPVVGRAGAGSACSGAGDGSRPTLARMRGGGAGGAGRRGGGPGGVGFADEDSPRVTA